VYRTLAGLLATLCAGLLLAALSFSSSALAPPTLRFVNGIEPDTLDPHLLTGQAAGRIVTALFEGLTRTEAKSLRPAPGVASSWEVSPDGRRYVFQLRADSYWSDGTPVTAADFVYSWRRVLDPRLGAEYAYMLHSLRGARAYNTFEELADSVERKLIPELERVTAERSSGLEAAAWQALAARLPLHDSLQHSTDPDLRALLDRAPAEQSAIPQPALARFTAALAQEAPRLRTAAADASARFGESLGVYALDPHTLVVELEAPTPYFLDITSFYPALPVPRHVVERHGGAWFLPETVVSNGPFVLESWRVNDRIRLRRNERYWGRSEVPAQSIEALPTENTTTALNLYLTGEADWLPSPNYPLDLVDELRQRPDFYRHAAFTVYYYRINTRRPPLSDARVREALNLAVDRRSITEQVLGLGQLPADHFLPPGVPGYTPPPSHLGLNVERARRLLAEAGFPEGRGFPSIGILYNTLEAHKKIAEVVADQLKRNLGITVVAYNQEWQSYLATSRNGDYDLARATWIGDYLDPNTFLDMWVTNGGNNQTGFSSPTYDAIIRAAADIESFAARPGPLLGMLKEPARIADALRTADGADAGARRALLDQARMQLLAEAEAILVQDAFPVLPVYFYVESGLAAPGLTGLYTELEQPDGSHVPNLRAVHPLRELGLEPGGGR
jgi:oligopeptide transport system substrate-binding protein